MGELYFILLIETLLILKFLCYGSKYFVHAFVTTGF